MELAAATQWRTRSRTGAWYSGGGAAKAGVFLSSVLGERNHPVPGAGRPVRVLLRLQELEQDEGRFFKIRLNSALPLSFTCHSSDIVLLVVSR